MSWQTNRKMSALELHAHHQFFEISQAGMGRFLGRSERTVRRWVRGEIKVPAAEVLLLRSLIAHDEKPTVPNWTRGDS